MSSLETTSLGDVGRWLARFGPYVALVTVVALTAGLAPGGGDDDTSAQLATAGGAGAAATVDGAAGAVGAEGTTSGAVGEQAGGAASGGSAVAGGGAAGAGLAPGGSAGAGGSSTAGGPSATGGTAGGAAGPAAAAAPGAVAAKAPKNCDAKSGKVKMPTITAPACVSGFDGDNGGATHRGVTKDEIKVVVYLAEPDPAAEAIAQAGGSDDSPEQVRQQYREWVDLYAANLETYGRKIKLSFLDASGPATDDSAARADALKVIQSGAFASLNAPNNTYISELAAKGVMCIQCGAALPAESYLKWAPHAWHSSQSSTWTNVHNVDFMQKFLWDKPAQYAGDPTMTTKKRVIGRVSYDTADGSYKQAREYFEREVKKRGMSLAATAVFNGYPDTTKAQQQARPVIQKMKAAGVTTVILASDPFSPIFFTQEATRQQYFPEWVATGVLVDTAFFARLYDQQQWSHMFAPSPLSARLPEAKSESMRLLQWFYGRGPTAEGGYNLIRLPAEMLLRGIHSAGEALTPKSYAAGQFALPLKPGGKTYAAISYGTKLWPIADYSGTDDVSLVWWDARAAGESEIGTNGVGLYRYVNGGQRYLPGKYPASVKWFDPAGTVTLYEDYPAGERPPDYPSPKR